MTRPFSKLCAMTVFMWMLAASVAHAQVKVVEVTGTVSYYIDKDDAGTVLSSDDCRYELLEGVEIYASRRVVFASTHSQGGPNTGHFNFDPANATSRIEEGPPANILFYYKGSKYVPALVQMSCSSKEKTHVNVTVLRPDQYQRIYGEKAYKRYLQFIQAHLQSIDGEAGRQLREQFQQDLEKWGAAAIGS